MECREEFGLVQSFRGLNIDVLLPVTTQTDVLVASDPRCHGEVGVL